jgi:transposase
VHEPPKQEERDGGRRRPLRRVRRAQKTVTACVRTPGTGGGRRAQVRTWRTFTQDLDQLRCWLVEQDVTVVVMEATGVYWKPVWYALEGHFELRLVNARHVKRVPGRKTDVKDAEWLAQLAECGLLAGSFVPPPAIRQLRDLTRYRTRLVQQRAQEVQRVDKLLEDAGIKLSSVASNTLGASARAMLEALIAGEDSPDRLAELAKGRLRPKIAQLRLALNGRFTDHHRVLLRIQLDHIDQLDLAITRLDDRVAEVIAPFARQHQRLCTIPGVGKRAAQIIIAEIGVDMTRFPGAGNLASWAGLCPGNRESAGKRQSGRITQGDVWLKSILVDCAWAVAHTKDTYLSAQFWRLARRGGKQRAAVAVAHSILVIAYHLLGNDTDYQDLGGDYFTRRDDPTARTRRLVRQLEQLGHQVTLSPAA